MKRLHWFWRTSIAITTGAAFGTVWLARNLMGWTDFLERLLEFLLRTVGLYVATCIVFVLPTLLPAFAMYGILTRFLRPIDKNNETLCRRCGHILRSISEPRCPECGEQI